MIILAIETSCDDTSVAIIRIKNQACPTGSFRRKSRIKEKKFEILSNIVSSQINIHKKWGGVVPNLASRAHTKNLPIVFEKALKESKLKTKDIDAIALTIGPGLSPSLLIGVHFARALAYKYSKPIIPVNHVEGHIYSNFLHAPLSFPVSSTRASSQMRGSSALSLRGTKQSLDSRQSLPRTAIRGGNDKIINDFQFPIMNLIVSGGHTSLYLMKGHRKYELIGRTRDDAAGEAFDKAAKMMGLGYPGGPVIARLAEQWKSALLSLPRKRESRPELNLDSRLHGNDKLIDFKFPRPMINSKDFDFSFSGLKTAVFYKLREISEHQKITKDIKMAVACEFQQAVVDVLIAKTISAAKKYSAKTIAISGGVSANSELRKQFEQKAKENNLTFLAPPKDMSTDNGLMIAIAGYYNWLAGNISTWDKIDADPNLRL